MGGDVDRAMKPFMHSLDNFHENKVVDPVAGAVAGYLGEGVAFDLLTWFKKVTDAETAQFIDTVIDDEVEHEQIAIEKLRELIRTTPLGWFKAQLGAYQMLYRMISASEPNSSGPISYTAFLRLGRANELVVSLATGMAKRVALIGLPSFKVGLPKLRILS